MKPFYYRLSMEKAAGNPAAFPYIQPITCAASFSREIPKSDNCIIQKLSFEKTLLLLFRKTSMLSMQKQPQSRSDTIGNLIYLSSTLPLVAVILLSYRITFFLFRIKIVTPVPIPMAIMRITMIHQGKSEDGSVPEG